MGFLKFRHTFFGVPNAEDDSIAGSNYIAVPLLLETTTTKQEAMLGKLAYVSFSSVTAT